MKILLIVPKVTPYVIELVAIFFAVSDKNQSKNKEKYIKITIKENKCEMFFLL